MMLALNIAPILFMFVLETLSDSPNKVTSRPCTRSPPQIDHGYAEEENKEVQRKDSWETGTILRYYCRSGYENSKYGSIRCNEHGVWVLHAADQLLPCDAPYPKCYREENTRTSGRRSQTDCPAGPAVYLVLVLIIIMCVTSPTVIRRYRQRQAANADQPSRPPLPNAMLITGPPRYNPSPQHRATGGELYPMQSGYPTQVDLHAPSVLHQWQDSSGLQLRLRNSLSTKEQSAAQRSAQAQMQNAAVQPM